MKRILMAILITGTLVVGLVGCGNNNALFSTIDDHTTKTINVDAVRTSEHTYYVDLDGNGDFETRLTALELEALRLQLEAEGKKLKIVGG